MKRVRDPQVLRDAMRTRDVSYREVAAVGGCSVGAIANVINGRDVPDDLARSIARFLRRPVAALFADVPSNDKRRSGQRKAAA